MFNFNFSGAMLSGGNSGGGSVSNGGNAETTTNAGQATSSGEGNFTVTGGSSGFISSNQFGTVMGSSNGGTSGMSMGQGTSSDVGESNFTGSVTGMGNNTFGGQLSGVFFLTPQQPAAVPVATGNNGGFASSIGSINLADTGVGMGTDANATSTGTGNTFGSSELIVNSLFGIAGGSASGTANGTTGAVGSNADPGVLGNFGLNGTSDNSFNNIGGAFLTTGAFGGSGGTVSGSSPPPGLFNFNPSGRQPAFGGAFTFGAQP
jgi:hypothetical protein